MNKARRKELYALIRMLKRVQFNDDIDDCINTLDNIKYDEEYAYNSIPENLQYSYRAEASEAAIEHMGDAFDALNEAQSCEDGNEFKDFIEDAIRKLENAVSV